MSETPEQNSKAGGGPPPTPPQPPIGSPPGGVSENRTIMLVLAYLGILALIPLLVEKNDPEVQWHAKHGLVLTAFWIVVSIVLGVLTMIPAVGCIIGLGTFLLPLVILGLHIFLIVKAMAGVRFKLPMISDFADQWK